MSYQNPTYCQNLSVAFSHNTFFGETQKNENSRNLRLDYYPFGSPMPSRSFNGNGYKFGFNGQEKENEIYGEGNTYSAEYWMYDSRLGRRWNLDPKPNPSFSDYATFANNPVLYSDLLGDTVEYANFKSRIMTTIGRFAGNNSFREGFKEMKKSDKTFVFNYEGRAEGNGDGGSVMQDCRVEDTYVLNWTLKSKQDASGSMTFASLWEESFHIDDTLGGKIWGGTNNSTMSFNHNSSMLMHQPMDFSETDAWIWRADNARKLPDVYSNKTKQSNGIYISYKQKNSLMQQIKNTSSLNERRIIVRNMLHGTYRIQYEPIIKDGIRYNPIPKIITKKGPYFNR